SKKGNHSFFKPASLIPKSQKGKALRRSYFREDLLFGEHSTIKVVSCVWGELLSIVRFYCRISRGPERRWFTLWRMLVV
ncbi:hypothetical protein Goshw_029480, partial [Gossypium schwendimanii]|nr:hypothetical protein [Gossypium schwendimanii]